MTAWVRTPLAARAGLPLPAIALVAIPALAIPLLSAAGCGGRRPGPPLVPVTGKVTFDGRPVHPGVVTFFDAELQGTSATIGPDGRYRVSCDRGPGLPAGEYRVTVQAIEPAADPDRPSLPHESVLERPRPRSTVLAAFQSPDQTPLRFTVGPADGGEELVCDLSLTTDTGGAR